MIKPAVAVLSFYWSYLLSSKISLKNNLALSGVLARIPFLFYPFFQNVWYLIFASAIYMLFSRAAIPAWMEILKLNLGKDERNKLFSFGSILAYSESVIIAVFIGTSLDTYQNAWKLFFVLSTILGLISIFIQLQTPAQKNIPNEKKVIKPWKDCFALLKKRKDFALFQIGSSFSGFGIMLAMPALALFYVDNLHLSHADIAISRYIFMGLGFVVFSYFWTKAMQKRTLNYLLGFVCFGFALFPFFIMLALYFKAWIYVAFLSYGITQAGSHLLWNLSGPNFAKNEDSSNFSATNVLMVGVRGLVAPLLGGVLCEFFGPIAVIVIAIAICLAGCFWMFSKSFSTREASLEG